MAIDEEKSRVLDEAYDERCKNDGKSWKGERVGL